MTIDLLRALSSFEAIDDMESEVAFFRTHVPWEAPEAYLHIIHKPAPLLALRASAMRLRMPESFTDFLAVQNGAHLFSSALHICGVHRPGQLLDRDRPLLLPPFNIEWENEELGRLDRDQFLAVGGYGFDGASVCIDRGTRQVNVFQRGPDRPVASWRDFNHWIESEIARLSTLFNKRGERLVEESQTVAPHNL